MKTLHIAGLVMLASSLALVGCGDDDDGGGGGGKSGSGGTAGSAGSGGSAGGGSGGTGNAGTGGTAGTGNAGAGGTSGGSAGTGGTAGTAGTGGSFPAAPTLGAQIDRMGRPAVNTALIEPLGDDPAKGMAKDDFNSKTPADAASFVPAIRASLAAMDGLDADCGNQAFYNQGGPDYAPLATVLANDVLLLNTAVGTCAAYLAVETMTAGQCGGRTLGMDVIDTSYSVLAGQGAVVTDGVALDADANQTATFPFLGPSTN